MGSKILLLLSLFTFSFMTTCHAATDGWLAVYWGQNSNEGSLKDTCDSGNFNIVILSFLNQFGCGRTKTLNLAHSLDLESEIKHCQQNNVEVLMGLGGPFGDYSLCSTQDAQELAKYLYDNFLSGTKAGPLGTLSLKGINFDIQSGSNLYWDDLVKELNSYKPKAPQKFYLGAAPQCPVGDSNLDAAIKTGLFDDLFVHFFNNPRCQYSNGNAQYLLTSWDKWTGLAPGSSVFLGIPAAPSAAPSGGFIAPNVLINNVLPEVKKAANYGGVVLYDRYNDEQTHYSDKILPYIPKFGFNSVTPISDAIYRCVFTTLNTIFPKPIYAKPN